MVDKNKVDFKKARFHLNESCCSSTAKLIDIDETDEICMNSLDELIEDDNNHNSNKNHNEQE